MKKLILLLNILLISVMFAKTTDKGSGRNDDIMKMQKSQVPGYYRFILGNYEITSINDGYSSMKIETYNGIDKVKVLEKLKKEYSNISVNGEDIRLNISVNTFLINTGKELILIDTGGGNLLGPSMGQSKKNIELSGYKPEDIDKVIFTHLHPDHAFGLFEDGKKTYPNATIYVNKKEADFWLKNENTRKELTDALNTYIKDVKYKTFEDGVEIVKGIKSILLPGHTIGHTGYEINSEGKKMLIWGDVTHGYEIQFTNPDISTNYDFNPDQARETRKTILKRVSKEEIIVGGAHLPFPGVGHIVENENGNGYRWIPLQYKPVEN